MASKSKAAGVNQVKKTEFHEEVKAAKGLVVVDFFATWCGPCRQIAPKIEKLSEQLSDVVFLKVDVDEDEDLAQEYEIQAMPTFFFIKNGVKVGSVTGANMEAIQSKIDELK